MELFRIIAMFLVLVVHADYYTLNAPTATELATTPVSAVTRIFIECLSIGCVNMFILISGWFGIRPKLKSFSNFVFQCLFFLWGIYLFCLITGWATLSVEGIASCFVALKINWFIKAYIGLYIIAPLLNAFVDQANEKQLRRLLICFFIFQSFYSWMTNDAAEFFKQGYSTMSFIGLYLLARYCRLYPNWFTQQSRWTDLTIFLALVAFHTITNVLKLPFLMSLAYVNPIVIVEALYLLLFFSKIQIQSRIINFVGASSFAAFLLHSNPNWQKQTFTIPVQNLYEQYDGIASIGMIFLFLITIYTIAVGIDQLRLLSWNRLWAIYERRR